MHYDFGKKYDDCYGNMLEDCLSLKNEPENLALFWTTVGKFYKEGKGLLFAGTEGNSGFYCDFNSSKATENEIETHIRKAKNGIQKYLDDEGVGGDCLMSWLQFTKQDTGRMLTRKTKYWTTIRRIISDDLKWDYEKTEDKPWWSYCAWSNLYKISPEKGGAPSPSLSENQKKNSKKLLEIEIYHLKPKAIIIFRKQDFDITFFENWNLTERKDSVIEYGGNYKGIPIAITKRPDSRKKGTTTEAFANEISKWLEKL